MTEKEAIKVIEIAIAEVEWDYPLDYAVAFETAIKALKEIQQYRAMNRKLRKCFGDCDGLLKAVVDEICYRISVKEPTKLRLLANEDADMWDAYRAVGTVEECREAMEKQKEKKCVIDHRSDHMYYRCPSCGQIQLSTYAHGFSRLGRITKYCENCGQALAEKEGKID